MSEKIKCELCHKVWEIPDKISGKEENNLWNRVYQHYHKHKVEKGLVRKRKSKYLKPVKAVKEPDEIKDSDQDIDNTFDDNGDDSLD